MAWNYKKAKEIKIPEQKKIVDPRSDTSIRGKNYRRKNGLERVRTVRKI